LTQRDLAAHARIGLHRGRTGPRLELHFRHQHVAALPTVCPVRLVARLGSTSQWSVPRGTSGEAKRRARRRPLCLACSE